MYCTCQNPKKVTSGAAGQTFEVCSKNLGGCGNEIVKKTMIQVDVKVTYSKPWEPVNQSINLAGLGNRPKEECPQCCGGGFIAKLYPNGHTEVTCEECDGRGWI